MQLPEAWRQGRIIWTGCQQVYIAVACTALLRSRPGICVMQCACAGQALAAIKPLYGGNHDACGTLWGQGSAKPVLAQQRVCSMSGIDLAYIDTTDLLDASSIIAAGGPEPSWLFSCKCQQLPRCEQC